MKTCKWCGGSFKKLGKSHIIPKSFMTLKGNKGEVITQDDFPKKRPTGVWDEDILCQKCESSFSYIDSKAAKILINDFEKTATKYKSKNYTYYLLPKLYKQVIKEFLIYTLWKSSVSLRSEFSKISLGPYEHIIKNDLINRKNFLWHEYSFVAYKIESSAGIVFPYYISRKTTEGINFIRLNLGIYIFDIKIDSRKPKNTYEIIAHNEKAIFIGLKETPKNTIELMKKIMIDSDKFQNTKKAPHHAPTRKNKLS